MKLIKCGAAGGSAGSGRPIGFESADVVARLRVGLAVEVDGVHHTRLGRLPVDDVLRREDVAVRMQCSREGNVGRVVVQAVVDVASRCGTER